MYGGCISGYVKASKTRLRSDLPSSYLLLTTLVTAMMKKFIQVTEGKNLMKKKYRYHLLKWTIIKAAKCDDCTLSVKAITLDALLYSLWIMVLVSAMVLNQLKRDRLRASIYLGIWSTMTLIRRLLTMLTYIQGSSLFWSLLNPVPNLKMFTLIS